MTTEIQATELEALIRDIRAQLAALAERVSRLETPAAPAVAAAPTEVTKEEALAAAEAPAAPEIGEEELLAISAALAAYFGVRVHVRQIRLISSSAWAQQGRVSIQASHRLF